MEISSRKSCNTTKAIYAYDETKETTFAYEVYNFDKNFESKCVKCGKKASVQVQDKLHWKKSLHLPGAERCKVLTTKYCFACSHSDVAFQALSFAKIVRESNI